MKIVHEKNLKKLNGKWSTDTSYKVDEVGQRKDSRDLTI